MIKLILDIVSAYLAAKYIKTIWFAVPMAIIFALISNIVVTIIFVQALPSDFTMPLMLGMIAGLIWHPVIAIVPFIIFRIAFRKKNEVVAAEWGGKVETVKDRYVEPDNQKSFDSEPDSFPEKIIDMVSKVQESDPSRQQTMVTSSFSMSDDFYESALCEYENGTMIKAIHARAIADSDGNQAKEKAYYIRLRVDAFKRAFDEQKKAALLAITSDMYDQAEAFRLCEETEGAKRIYQSIINEYPTCKEADFCRFRVKQLN